MKRIIQSTGSIFIGAWLFRQAVNWLTDREIAKHTIGEISNTIEVYSYKNSSGTIEPESQDTYDLIPAFYSIIDHDSEQFQIGDTTCVLHQDVDVSSCTCELLQIKHKHNEGSFSNILHNPTQLRLRLEKGQRIIAQGEQKDGFVLVKKISNYPYERYSRMIMAYQERKVALWVLTLIFGAGTFYYYKYKIDR